MKQAIIESGRAEFALNKVKEVKNCDKSVAKHYKSYVRNFSTLVLSNGLASTVAFVFEKSKGDGKEKKAYKYIYDQVSSWLEQNNFLTGKSLEEYVCSLNSDEYRVVTNEILSLFTWFKRFASGLIEGEAE